MKRNIPKAMVAEWIGSDHMNVEELLSLLTEIVNGDYTPEEFAEDVRSYPACDDWFEEKTK